MELSVNIFDLNEIELILAWGEHSIITAFNCIHVKSNLLLKSILQTNLETMRKFLVCQMFELDGYM